MRVRCDFCDQDVESNSAEAQVLVTVWKAKNQKTIKRIVTEPQAWAHSWCLEEKQILQGESLF